MEFEMPSVVFLAAMGSAGLALVFQISGVATAGWLVSDAVEMGLWEACVKDKACHLLSFNLPGWLHAVRALGIMGIVCLIGCLLASGVSCFLDNAKLVAMAPFLAFVGGLFILTEFAVFAENHEEIVPAKVASFVVLKSSFDLLSYSFDLGYSFALTVVAWLLAMLSCGVFMFEKLRENCFPALGGQEEDPPATPE